MKQLSDMAISTPISSRKVLFPSQKPSHHSTFHNFKLPNDSILTVRTTLKVPPVTMLGIHNVGNGPELLPTASSESSPQPTSSSLSRPNTLPHSLQRPSANWPSQNPTRSLFKTIVTITVGPNKCPFHIHLESLCAISPFFAAAFSQTYAFSESRSLTLNLPEARPADFEYLVQWLYTRTLTHEDLTPGGGNPVAFFRLIRLYLLAEQLQVSALRDCIVDDVAVLADRTNSVPTPDDTRALWGEGREGCGLRRLVLDLFVWKRTENLVETHEDSWDEGFLRELVGKLKRVEGKKGNAPWRSKDELCRCYHEHGVDASCSATGGDVQGDTAAAVRPKVAGTGSARASS